MLADERRQRIIECLSFRRYDTIQHLADEFGVSWRTIQRDIQYLETQYPLRTIRGGGGGVVLQKGYYISQRRLSPKQADALRRVIPLAHEDDREILESILYAFAG